MNEVVLVDLVGESACPICRATLRIAASRIDEVVSRCWPSIRWNVVCWPGCARPGHEHQEAHEVVAALVRALDLDKAFPELGPLRRLPAVVALEDRNHILARRVEDLAERLDRGLHSPDSPNATIGNHKTAISGHWLCRADKGHTLCGHNFKRFLIAVGRRNLLVQEQLVQQQPVLVQLIQVTRIKGLEECDHARLMLQIAG